MKKRELDHVLRAAGRITGEKQFVIVGSQSLHGKYPDVADDILRSAEVDLIAKKNPEKTESLNVKEFRPISLGISPPARFRNYIPFRGSTR